MVDETVVQVRTTQVGVTCGSLDLEDTFLNREEGDIESSSSEIEDQNVALASALLVKTVGDGGSGGSLMIRRTLGLAIFPASFVA